MRIKLLRLKELLKILSSFAFIVLLAAYPSVCITGAKNGLKVAVYSVMPSLFPFMIMAKYIIFSGLIFKVGKHFKLMPKLFKLTPNECCAMCISTLSGYPSGSVMISDMVKNGQISGSRAEYIMPYISNCSPLFIIGAVGTSMLLNRKCGYILYIIHIVSSLIYAFISRQNIPPETKNNPICRNMPHNPFISAVKDSISAMLSIIAYIIFFSVISEFITAFIKLKSDLIISLITSAVEISGGCLMLSNIPVAPAFKLALISFILGFSGICVILQTADVLSENKTSVIPYIKGRLYIGFISSVITYIVFTVMPARLNVFSSCAPQIEKNMPFWFAIAFIPAMIILYITTKENKK